MAKPFFAIPFNLFLSLAALLLFSLSACKKDDAPPAPVVPTVTTAAITNLTYNSATSGGVITSDGGATVTVSGICWSKTNTTPALTDSVTSGTTATGSFVSTLTNLAENTTYYLRAFATNSAGTGYGNVVTFTTTTDTTTVTFTYNGATVTYGVIISAASGRTWMDRNLGASRVATAIDDYQAYGDKFQWGRPADGHQLMTYTSSTAGDLVNGKTNTLATSDAPGNALFITPFFSTPTSIGVEGADWRDNKNTNRWATNNQGPCPAGWHVPSYEEWFAEVKSLAAGGVSPQGTSTSSSAITNSNSAASLLKLTAAGRIHGINDGQGVDGVLRWAGSNMHYWCSNAYVPQHGPSDRIGCAPGLFVTSGTVAVGSDFDRSFGLSIRCIKNN